MIDRRRFVTASAAGLAAASMSRMPRALAEIGSGQTGGKTTRLMIGVPPGGGTDVIARLLAEQMTGYASPLIVENRPGAAERIALEALKNSPADGSVFMLTGSSPMAVLPHAYKQLKYDPSKDFIPVTTVCTFSFMLTVGPLVPQSVKTLDDFIQWCRANPKQATYGTLGVGTPHYFLGFMLARAAGFELTHVPYQGAAAVQDLLAGQIAATFYPVGNTLPHVQSGKLRGLVITGRQRSAQLPDVPTMREAGYPALELVDWFGIFVPAQTPADTVTRLNAAVHEALKAREVRAGMEKLAFDPAGSSPAELARLISMDSERWGPIVKASGFRPEE
jgi:tripartite-type tricarboxylate transporter receptor subunit TctC